MSSGDFHKQETQPGVARRPRTRSEYPATIAGFKIDSILEEGGMSLVYLATHPDTGELITLKVLSPDFLDNEEILARFLKEASIIAMADHPNIVKLYTQGKWEGGLYIAMEYIPGISLHEMLKTTTLSLRKALEITLEVAYALCHLHSFGVIHRDLKPENILVGKNGHVKVIDFGIAQVMTEKGTSGTGRRRIIGTPVYMSPEQQKDPESVTYASDIYSLGIIAYELVLGKLSSGKVHLSLVPTKLQSILAKCLAKNPDERYQDVVDLIADLSLFMNEETVGENRNPAAMLEELFEEMKSAREDLVHKNSEAIALEMHDSSVSAGAVVRLYRHRKGFILLTARGKSSGVGGLMHNMRLAHLIDTLPLAEWDPIQILEGFNEALIKNGLSSETALLLKNEAESFLEYFSAGMGCLAEYRGESQTIGLYQGAPNSLPLENGQIKTTVIPLKKDSGFIFSSVSADQFALEDLDWKDQVVSAFKAAPPNIAEYLMRKTLAQIRIPSLLIAEI